MATHHQLVKFALVGLGSNLFLFVFYLTLTAASMGHKTAMSVAYVTGVCLTFALNRNWSFAHSGSVGRSFAAYVGIYVVGYVMNFAALYLFVDTLGYDHRVVQATMVLVVALLLFSLQKTVVFRDSTANSNARHAARLKR